MAATPTYYSPDAILTDAQKVPLTIDLTVPGLGYLNNQAGSDLKEGTRLEAPLWLAEMLAVSRPTGNSSLASLDLPAALGPRVLNALRADPNSVDLRAQGRWFYGLSERMLELFDEEDVVAVVTDTFKKRAVEIADNASNSRAVPTEASDFMRGLDDAERTLFRQAHDGTQAVRKWLEKDSRA